MPTLTLQSRDYLRGRGTRVLLSDPRHPAELNKPSAQVEETAQVVNALPMEPTDTVMVLSGRVPGTISGGTSLTFNTDSWSESLTLDSSSVAPYEYQLTFTSGPSSTLPAFSYSSSFLISNPALVEVLSINSVNPSFSANEVTSRNFKSGLYTSRRQVSVEGSISLSGKLVVGDQGVHRASLAASQGRKLFFQIIYPDYTGLEGWSYVSSFGQTASMDDDAEFSLDLNIDGKSYPLNSFPSF